MSIPFTRRSSPTGSRRWSQGALAGVLVLLLAGASACGSGGGGGGTGAGEPVKLSVQDTAGVPSAFLQYGVKLGHFKKRKLTLDIQLSQSGAAVLPSVLSGDTDIGGSNLLTVLTAQSKTLPVKIVAPGTFVQDNAKDDFSAIFVAKDSPIRSPKDLEGKTLAINALKNITEVTAKQSLRKQGVDISKVKLTEVDFPEMAGAVEGGRVDAAFAIEPFVTAARQAGHRVIDRPYSNTKRGLQVGCYFASDQFIAKNGDALERFRAGVGDTAKSIKRDPAAFRKFLPEATEIPAAEAQKVALPAWHSRSDPRSAEFIAVLMERFDITKAKPETKGALKE